MAAKAIFESSPNSRPELPGGPILIVGLARSGIALALTLRERGIEVIGCDSGSIASQDRDRLVEAGVEVAAPSDGVALLEGVSALVKSPGVPRQVPVIEEALARGIEVLGELEIAWRLLPRRFVAVTGSNGKTTTVELIGHILRTAGRPEIVAGNVGTPLSGLVGSLSPDTTVVCEASSFQLEDSVLFAPEISVLLNITEDHLDRHGTLANYEAAKRKVLENQSESQVAIVSDQLGYDGRARLVQFGQEPGSAATVVDNFISWQGNPVIAIDQLKLRGSHNIENVLAATAVAMELGVTVEVLASGLRTFTGVPHRLEQVAEVSGVLYVNDSKATNIASAQAAIASFDQGIHLILGGKGKDTDYEPLKDLVSRHCSATYLIGEDAPRLNEALKDSGVTITNCGDLSEALSHACREATPGEVVLLAPAAASYDQYRSFEERGDHFRELVKKIRG